MSIRGLFTHAGILYSVDGNALQSISATGTRTTVGTLNSIGGVVDFASNLTQLCVNDGSYLYVYSPSAGTLVTTAGYTGGPRIAFLDQRILFLANGTQRFGWTALGDATSIGALDFASAEGAPDNLMALLADHREAWLFGSASVEVWNSVGGLSVFERNQSAFIEYGCAASQSAQKSANSVTWLSRDERGQAMVLRAQGYVPSRISTRAIEERFEGLDLTAARAYTYSDGGQQFYCLNCPGVDTTLVYDETFQQWHERAELTDGAYQPWRATSHAFAYGYHFFGADDGVIYKLDSTVNTFGSSVKCRDRVAPVISAPNHKRLRYPLFELLCEKGTTGKALLRWSDDNGYTWSDWHPASAGLIGQYARRLRWLRTGSGFDRVFQVRMTDDAPFNPVLANVEAV